ncbi:MAG: YcxB family protein [Polyangiaceae bacterium]|nr:YcxB family protein [Polyangiaceae bacterium]
MQLEFDLTRDDYAALAFARSPSASRVRQRWGLLAVLLCLVALLMALLTFLTGGTEWLDDTPLLRPLLYLIGGSLGAFALVSALVAGLRLWVRRLPRDDGATLGRHQIELADDGFHVEGRSGRAFVRWSAVVELREVEAHVFLYVDRMMAYVIPKRAFASPGECARFVAFAKQHVGVRTN